MKTLVIAGCRCGSHTLQKTLEKNGFSSRRGHNSQHYKFLYKDEDILDYIDGDEEITLIDVYRPPIERKLSMFFKNIMNNSNLREKTVEDLNSAFCYYFKNINGYNHYSNFIIPKYKLNIPNFDFEKGYVKVTQGKITYVKILFSDIHRWGDILSEVFKKKIRIYEDNITTKQKYKETRDCLRINKIIYNFIIKDPYLKKNMTELDRENYLNFWRERIIN
jgi:hypothetical protein